jgi:hypothetical protein
MKWVTNDYQYGVYFVLYTILIIHILNNTIIQHCIEIYKVIMGKLNILVKKKSETNQMSFWCLQVTSISNINGVTVESIREQRLRIY